MATSCDNGGHTTDLHGRHLVVMVCTSHGSGVMVDAHVLISEMRDRARLGARGRPGAGFRERLQIFRFEPFEPA